MRPMLRFNNQYKAAAHPKLPYSRYKVGLRHNIHLIELICLKQQ